MSAEVEKIVSVAAILSGSFALNAIFLRSKLGKIDKVYDAICGTTETKGLRQRVDTLEEILYGRRSTDKPKSAHP